MSLTPLISEPITSTKYLQFVSFSMLNDWSIYSILGEKVGYNNSYSLEKIGRFLIRNKTAVLVEDSIEYKRPTIKMNNKGVQLRDIEVGKNIGTKKQFRVTKGQFLLSKIDARNGAFGVVYDDCDNSIITGNFWTFDVDYSLIIPEYLNLVTSTKKFHELCQSASVGTTGRHYLRESSFLDTKIPLPDLTTQSRIVREYHDRISEAARLEQIARDGEKQIESYLIDALGITIENTEKKRGINFVRFKDIGQWGLDFIFNSFHSSSKYDQVSINTLCKISSGGTPSRSNLKYYGGNIPWIKTGELNHDIILDTAEKITQLGLENSSCKLYEKGSLIIAMYGATIGKTAKLGVQSTTNQACAVLFDFKEELIDVDFLWIFLQSQTDNFKKMAYGGAQPNINAGIVGNYQIPRIPLSFQTEIVSKINLMKSELDSVKQQVERLRVDAKESFERELFA